MTWTFIVGLILSISGLAWFLAASLINQDGDPSDLQMLTGLPIPMNRHALYPFILIIAGCLLIFFSMDMPA